MKMNVRKTFKVAVISGTSYCCKTNCSKPWQLKGAHVGFISCGCGSGCGSSGTGLEASHMLVQLLARLLSSAETMAGGPCLRRWLLAGGCGSLPRRSPQRLIVPSWGVAAGATLRKWSEKERQSCTNYTSVPLVLRVGPAAPWEGKGRHAAGRWDSPGSLEAGHCNADLYFVTIEKLLCVVN